MIEIRLIRPDDIPGVIRLVDEAGFPERSADGWHWALFGNPDQGEIPPGLIAVRNRRLVAMVGLQARKFTSSGQNLTAVCGHTFIAGEDGRGAGFALARRALQSYGSTAIYSLNTNALADTFHRKIGLNAWLGPSGRTRMEWPVHSVTMAAGVALTRFAATRTFMTGSRGANSLPAHPDGLPGIFARAARSSLSIRPSRTTPG